MSIASIKAGRAFYEIFAEDKTDKGISSAEKRLKAFGKRIAAIGAAMTAAGVGALTGLTAMVRQFASAGDNLADASAQTGLSTDFLQSLRAGAADAGVPFEGLLTSMNKFQGLLADAANGSAQAADKLSALGLSAEELMSMTPDQQFKALADAIARIPNPAERAAAAIDVFGKSGAKLLPMLADGAEGLNKQLAELKRRGRIMSPEDVALAAKAVGAWLSLQLGLGRVVEVIGSALAPAFIAVAKAIDAALDPVIKFISANRGLVASIAIGLGVIAGLGIVLVGLGTALTLAGPALAAIGTAAAVITSPITIVTAAIVACGVAAGVAAYHLDQLFNEGRGLNFLKDATAALKLFFAALIGGEWSLIGELIAASIDLAFDGLLLKLKSTWSEFLQFIGQDALDLSADISSAVASTNRLAEIAQKIQATSTWDSLFGGGKGGGDRRSLVRMPGQLANELQTLGGGTSSSAAGRLNWSAMGNSWERTQEKILEVVRDELGHMKSIDEHIQGLSSLSVE